MKAKIEKFMNQLQDNNSTINVLDLHSELTRYKESPVFYDRLDTTKFCKAFMQMHPQYDNKFTTVERNFRRIRADIRLQQVLNNDIPTDVKL